MFVGNYRDYQFRDVPELPEGFSGELKGTKTITPISRSGTQFIAMHSVPRGYSLENYDLDKLPRNHPDVIQHVDELKKQGKYPNIVIFKVPEYIIPYLFLINYDDHELLEVDSTALERDILQWKLDRAEALLNSHGINVYKKLMVKFFYCIY